VPSVFQSTFAFGNIFIHGKIHEAATGFLPKFISPFSLMNTRTQVAAEETTIIYGMVLQIGEN
jgi:hypothetical protein